ncbi:MULTISPECIES: hypothetical protein [Gammaproteobacteria]|uniref:Lipoprotein n=2 Tax=Gammaproteobacteria TaxID=1236 RepID=A0A368TP43_9GAMM|nr:MULTISPECIES: hypothetical protein [Gammaproteobacteria]MBH0040687.1 hypothetical protein [Pseudoalteromonas sp. SWN166]MBQ5557936.1 hypothetical protein [Aeriscardovia sp.]MBQ9002986.1 hypothetical protein [Eggerthellaceae bacterium]MBR2407122.1 hypothetical protein [Clostridia bacterium]MBH0013683.1 hypothetical protein [Pseudoalteromonas sp. NZS100_1]
MTARTTTILLLALALAGCSEDKIKAMEAINEFCKKNNGELTTVFEHGTFGSKLTFGCTARAYP